MNQSTLGGQLAAQYPLDCNVKVSVQAQATGDVNVPTWSTLATGVIVELQALTAEARLREAAAYEQQITHQAFAVEASTLKIGHRLVETHRQNTAGAWVSISDGSALTLEILGKERVPALAGVNMQVRLALSQTNPVT